MARLEAGDFLGTIMFNQRSQIESMLKTYSITSLFFLFTFFVILVVDPSRIAMSWMDCCLSVLGNTTLRFVFVGNRRHGDRDGSTKVIFNIDSPQDICGSTGIDVSSGRNRLRAS